jgi:mycothiol synthase
MDGYSYRRPTVDDLDAVAAIMLADDLDAGSEPTLDKGFLREEWSKPGFDLAADAWVAVNHAGGVVAYGQVAREEEVVADSWGVVHPAHRGRGVGSGLLDRIEDRATHKLDGISSGIFRHGINADDRAAAAMLDARGMRLVRHFWHMQIDLDGAFDPGATPAGIDVRAVGSDDLRAVHAVFAETLGDHSWRPHAQEFEGWAEEEMGSPTYDPTLWLLASDAGDLVGALTASDFGDRGWISEVGVRRTHRGRGVGAALLRRSFALFARRGRPRVLLNVDAENPTGATALYEKVGMRVVKRWELWERSLAAR